MDVYRFMVKNKNLVNAPIKTNQNDALSALNRLELSGKKLGDQWLKKQGLNPEDVSEEEFYNLLKYGTADKSN